MLKSVEHLAIFAQDSTSLARWYCDTLGFETVVALEDKGQYFLRLPGDGFYAGVAYAYNNNDGLHPRRLPFCLNLPGPCQDGWTLIIDPE